MTLTLRMIAIDPMMSNGQRIHTLGPWPSPEDHLASFMKVMNTAKPGFCQPEGGSVGSAIKYTDSVGYQPISQQYGPFAQDPNVPVVRLSGDEFRDKRNGDRQWPYMGMEQGNAYLGVVLEDQFNLIPDANAGKFQLLLIWAPGADASEGGYQGFAESWLFSAADDPDAYGVNAGQVFAYQPPPNAEGYRVLGFEFYRDHTMHQVRIPSPSYRVGGERRWTEGDSHNFAAQFGGSELKHDRKFVALYCNATRRDEVAHSYYHAMESILWHRFGFKPPTDGIGSAGPADLLWAMDDDIDGDSWGVVGEGNIGRCHFAVNSYGGDYSYNDPGTDPNRLEKSGDVVPSSWSALAQLPADLGSNTRRHPVAPRDWMLGLGWQGVNEGARSYAYRFGKFPAWAWPYIEDVNLPTPAVTPATTGPVNGGRDLRLRVEDLGGGTRKVLLTWARQREPSGRLLVAEAVDYGPWKLLTKDPLPAGTTQYQLMVEADSKLHIYGLLWESPTGWLRSDILGFVPGTATIRSTRWVEIACYQQGLAYLRCSAEDDLEQNRGYITLVDAADPSLELWRVVKTDGHKGFSIADLDGPQAPRLFYIGEWNAAGQLVGSTDAMGYLPGASEV